MLAAFCLRLALGLLVPLPMLPDKELHPKFFKTQFLTALGLCTIAALMEWWTAGLTGRLLLIASGILTFAGSIAWSLEPPPFGKTLVIAASTVLAVLVGGPHLLGQPDVAPAWIPIIDGLGSAMLIGSALTAMLVGHSYLISPGMTLRPLNRMLGIFAIALFVRACTAAAGYLLWSAANPERSLTGAVAYWLPLRWLVGIIAPAGFGLMAYLTARIRSTQSATGILYVVVICTVLGELLAMLLRQTAIEPM